MFQEIHLTDSFTDCESFENALCIKKKKKSKGCWLNNNHTGKCFYERPLCGKEIEGCKIICRKEIEHIGPCEWGKCKFKMCDLTIGHNGMHKRQLNQEYYHNMFNPHPKHWIELYKKKESNSK